MTPLEYVPNYGTIRFRDSHGIADSMELYSDMTK